MGSIISPPWRGLRAWQLMHTAAGSMAMCVGAAFIRTASAVVRPPRPWGPMPVAFMASSSSRSILSYSSSGLGSSRGRSSASFARRDTLSKPPPMPTPTTHRRAGLAGPRASPRRARTRARPPRRRRGLSIFTAHMFSLPAPLGATVRRSLVPRHEAEIDGGRGVVAGVAAAEGGSRTTLLPLDRVFSRGARPPARPPQSRRRARPRPARQRR